MSRYKTSDFLCDRHPYDEPSFKEKQQSEVNDVMLSYGRRGFEKLCELLLKGLAAKDTAIALRIMKNLMFTQEEKIRAVEVNSVPALNHVLQSYDDEDVVVEACNVLSALSKIDPTRRAVGNIETLELIQATVLGSGNEAKMSAGCALLSVSTGSLHGCQIVSDFSEHSIDESNTMLTQISGIISTSTVPVNCRVSALTVIYNMSSYFETRKECLRGGAAPAVVVAGRDAMKEKNEILLEAMGKAASEICIDSNGQKLSSSYSKEYGLFLRTAMENDFEECIRLLSGVMASLSVNEAAKRLFTENFEGEEKNSVDVVLELLIEVDKTETDIVENAVSFLRSVSHLPHGREQVCKQLKPKKKKFRAVYEGTTLLQSYGSDEKDLMPL